MSPRPRREQYMTALGRANRTRLARAELKRRIARGDATVADVLNPGDPIPWEARTMSIAELLCSQTRWGATRARKLVNRVGIGEQKAVGTLTPRQRRMLVEALSDPERPMIGMAA